MKHNKNKLLDSMLEKSNLQFFSSGILYVNDPFFITRWNLKDNIFTSTLSFTQLEPESFSFNTEESNIPDGWNLFGFSQSFRRLEVINAPYHRNTHMGVSVLLRPGINIKRNPLCGRNFEYFSEDPYLTGKLASSMVKGIQSNGISACAKHFAMNDQEVNARSGIVIHANEQAIREIYLKPFEITVKDADPKAVMSSFSYIGSQWAGAHSGLLNDILRDKWGFEGFVSTDAVFGHMTADKAIVSGNDLMLDIMSHHTNKKVLKKAYKENPEHIVNGLQTSVHNVLYTHANFDS